MMPFTSNAFLRAALVLLSALLVGADSPDPSSVSRAGQEQLSELQVLVGEWRGVGQPKRGSNTDAWTEEGQWAWKFGKDAAALVMVSPEGKYFTAARLEAGDKENEYRLIATLPEKAGEVAYSGALDDQERLTLSIEKPQEGLPDRISIRTVAKGDRLLILYERRLGSTSRYLRLAEVGYTRRGSGFGQGNVQRECVVTGGLGTIAVMHEGKTYYVCCSGCKALFIEDPVGVLADYKARKEEEKQKRARQ